MLKKRKLSGAEENFMANQARPANAQEIYLGNRKKALKNKRLGARIVEALGPKNKFSKRERL